MRNLYINLFESNIIENSPITEGAWGYGILDNDVALDKQSQFGEFSLKLLTAKINTSTTDDEKWANLGVLVDFLKKYDNEEIRFDDEYNSAIELCKKTCKELINNKNFISSWDDESKIKSQLKHIFNDVMELTYDKERLNEDGEGGGATSADASGQFTTSCFGGPINKKTMYITQEQEEYIKKIIKEESVMDTPIGNFGCDAPMGDGKKNKNNKFFADANDHKDMMKQSWPRQ